MPISVVVGTPGVTFYVHKNVLALSPLLERMCETRKAKEAARIALPDENIGIFEHLLGYLYFQNFEPPIGTPEWDSLRPNDIIMETYVMAAKYGVDGLRPLLLGHLDLDISINELCRLAAIVYDAGAEIGDFSVFFVSSVTNMLKQPPVEVDDKGWRSSSPSNLHHWGERGGRLGRDLTYALANMAITQPKPAVGICTDELCGECGEVDCQCERYCNGNERAQGNWDYEDSNSRPSDDDGHRNAEIKEMTKESKTINVSDQITELTDKVNLLVAQLGNRVGSGLEEGVGKTASMPLRQLAEAESFPTHYPSSGADQGEPNQIGNIWGNPLPSTINRPCGPPVNNRLTSGDCAMIALRASDSWDCTLSFPAGAIITNVVSRSAATFTPQTIDSAQVGVLGSSRYRGWYNGRWGEFPARYVDGKVGLKPSGDGTD